MKEDKQTQILETQAEITAIKDTIEGSRIADLTGLVSGSGLTQAQYRKVTGRSARPAIVVKGKIPWHLALDELATERGFKGDEELKEAIEDIRELKHRLAGLKKTQHALESELKAPLKAETVRLKADDKHFPDEETQAEIIAIDGKNYSMKRSRSYCELFDGENAVGRVKYATVARKIIKGAAKSFRRKKTK